MGCWVEVQGGSARTQAAIRNRDEGGQSAWEVSQFGQGNEAKGKEAAAVSDYYSNKSQPQEGKEQSVQLKSACESDGAAC